MASTFFFWRQLFPVFIFYFQILFWPRWDAKWNTLKTNHPLILRIINLAWKLFCFFCSKIIRNGTVFCFSYIHKRDWLKERNQFTATRVFTIFSNPDNEIPFAAARCFCSKTFMIAFALSWIFLRILLFAMPDSANTSMQTPS